MVQRYNAKFRFQDTTSDVHWIKPVNVFIPVHAPIVRGAIHRHQTKMTFKLYANVQSAGVGGYDSYLRENTGSPATLSCGGWSFPITCTLGEYATEEGDLDGAEFAGNPLNFRFRAWWTKQGSAPSPGRVSIRTTVYHRTSGGTETSLTWFLTLITAVPTTYTTTVSFTKVFGKGDRLVVKWVSTFTAPDDE